jgi:hypothetical protein
MTTLTKGLVQGTLSLDISLEVSATNEILAQMEAETVIDTTMSRTVQIPLYDGSGQYLGTMRVDDYQFTKECYTPIED